MTLYTLGYGNRQPEDFFALIPERAILVDVRRTARAWSPAYGEGGLRKRLGDRYQWFRSLGNAESGTADVWVQCEEWHDAIAAIITIGWLVRAGELVVLLCAEADPMRCHRRFVAEAIAERVPGLEIAHLGVPTRKADL